MKVLKAVREGKIWKQKVWVEVNALNKQRKESREEVRKAVEEVVRTQEAKMLDLRIKIREILEEKMKLERDNRTLEEKMKQEYDRI